MKNRSIVMFAFILVVSGLTACGTVTGTATDADRLIAGEITTDSSGAVALTTSDKSTDPDCVGDVCQVIAVSSTGEVVHGEILGEAYTWNVRLSPGTWMIGFYDSEGALISYLSVNGSNAFTLSAGEDLELGQVYFQNGQAVLLDDAAGLAQNGFTFAHAQDTDMDGVLDDFDDDAPGYDPSIFSVVRTAPYANEEMVALCRPIKLHLSQAIDEATLTAAALVVTNANSTVLDGTLSYEADLEDGEYEVEFVPSSSLALSDVITVTLPADDTGLKNTLGETLLETLTWSFTVRDFDSGSTSCHDLEDSEEGDSGDNGAGSVEDNNGADNSDDHNGRAETEDGEDDLGH